MSSTDSGRKAEAAVCEHLKKLGYSIVAKNWRARVCEIDIIARKKDIVYFVEVKYRASSAQGGGLEYITSAKLKQMKFAAEVWCHSSEWEGDYRIVGIAASQADDKIKIGELVEVA